MGDQQNIFNKDYKYGFVTNIESDTLTKGLTEKTIYYISKKKNEPQFILDFRLDAFHKWQKMSEPKWANLEYPPINYQDISYYSEPKKKAKLNKIEDADPEILKTLDKLGIPTDEKNRLLNVAVDVVFDSVSLGTTFKEKLQALGVVLCPISEAIQKYPDLIKKYLASVVPVEDNFFAALNSAVFSDGSFVYVPKKVKCPIELSTYFRINEKEIGQFERTLIIAEDSSYVSYLEGCTAPAFDVNQLHAAVVEIIALDNAEVKYSTVQNWYSGDEKGVGGIYNFVTKRGLCKGKNSKISWTQVEVGSAITWKYPSCILKGDNSIGEFYSVALTHKKMQAESGTKMIHLGKNTKSRIVAKGISADCAKNSFRALIRVAPTANNAKCSSSCESMLVGNQCSANTFPTFDIKNNLAVVEHEASTCKLGEDQIFYLQSRGLSKEDAIQMILKGFCEEVIKELPFEFAMESQKLLALKLEKSIG
ncbi:MAG: Fe-S cluster assembly protein SufB [Chlamydiae bacterium]|nr:Fe-S cluster assembly protein SufB [Chlamydiota bacterium]